MKAIIVFDIDDKYAKKLDELEVEYHVYHYGNGDDIDEGRIEPKLMPRKRNKDRVPTMTVINGKAVNEYDLGWNDCIDEMLKEGEDYDSCYPYGREAYDKERYQNLLLKIAVVEELVNEIIDAGKLYNRGEYSILRISNKANEYLTDLRDWLNDIEYLPEREIEE